MVGGSELFIGSDQYHPQEKEMQKENGCLRRPYK